MLDEWTRRSDRRRVWMSQDVLVLCYHAVSERWPAMLSVTPHRLERQLRLLVGRGYRGVTFHQAVTSPPAPRTVAVTFDDAFESVLELGLPILSRLGLPGTVFVPSAFPGSKQPMAWPGIDEWLGGPYERELVPMSWDELNGLADAGWEIGSHTRTHPRLTELSDAELEAELTGSREQCEAMLGRSCPSIAYPYGDHDARVIEAAGRCGYESAATLPGPLHEPSPLRWPRVGVFGIDHSLRFRAKVSPTVRRLRLPKRREVGALG